MIDVGLVGETTVCGLAAHSLVPGTVEALQVGLSLVEGGEETDVVKHQDLKESGERERVCVCAFILKPGMSSVTHLKNASDSGTFKILVFLLHIII